MEDRPWCEFKGGKPITPPSLARRLKLFGVKPKTIRVSPYETKKGYELEQFSDAFARYLASPPSQSVTPLQRSNDAGFSEYQGVTNHNHVTDCFNDNILNSKDCYGVTFQDVLEEPCTSINLTEVNIDELLKGIPQVSCKNRLQ